MAKSSFYRGNPTVHVETVGPSPAGVDQAAGKAKSSFYVENPSVDHLNEATDILALASDVKDRATQAANEAAAVKTDVLDVQTDVLDAKTEVLDAKDAVVQAKSDVETALTEINAKFARLVQATFEANQGQTTFTIPGGYTPGRISVYVQGRKMRNGDDVDVSSGTVIVFASGLNAGNIVDVDALLTQPVANDTLEVGVIQASDIFVDGSPVWTQDTLDEQTLTKKNGTAQMGQVVIAAGSGINSEADNAPVVIREAGLNGSGTLTNSAAPSLGFVWMGATNSTIAMHSDGNFYFRSNNFTGTQYRDIYAKVMHGTATSAMYADLAERYAADEVLEPGTVVELGGPAEIRKTTVKSNLDVFGVISTAPAFRMNDAAGNDETHPFVALAGRVPCKVVGPVRKGQRLVSSDIPGVAIAYEGSEISFAIIGRALEDKTTTEVGLIEVVLGAK